MGDWCDDPAELWMRLDAAWCEIADLKADNERLRRELFAHDVVGPAHLLRQAPTAGSREMGGPVYAGSDPAEKVALFRSLFAGRADVYATQWTSVKTGKSGWSPAEKDRWGRRRETERQFLPLTDAVLFDHLAGTGGRDGSHVGIYPMLTDDECRLLVCDFDDHDWRADTAAFHRACQKAGVPALVEISRSGQGAHVWIFFTEPVAAGLARSLGAGLLREAIASRSGMSLSSYDRFFPAQDFLPVNAKGKARLGNLIALPLNGACRKTGTTVFCDPESFEPVDDQFAHLSAVRRLSLVEVKQIVDSLGANLAAGPTLLAASLPPRPGRGGLGSAPTVVPARLSAMLEVATAGLPARLVAALKHAACLHNPEFYRKQKQRLSTFATPRLVRCFDDTDGDWLRLPRGLRDEAMALIASAGGGLEITDELPQPDKLDVTFTGDLTPVQAEAVNAMAGYDTGVLVAPPGAGKTVMACALIARHQQATAVIVNRAELITQWRDRIAAFLNLGEAGLGTLGRGRDTRTGAIDVVMLQTLAHRDAADGLLDGYGMVIVDECHALGAPAAQAAINKVRVRQWLGLSATPYRADGMDAIITMQAGPIRHEITDTAPLVKQLIVHATDFTTDETGRDGASIQAIYNELAAYDRRNRLIADGIVDAHQRRRNVLVLANRVEQLQRVSDILQQRDVVPMLLHGGMTPPGRRRVLDVLQAEPSQPVVVLAIDKIAGEGFDAPILDTVFLTSPVSFKGRILQYIGRIMRTGRVDVIKRVEVHDYLDAQVPLLERMHHKRRRLLKRHGFTIHTSNADPTPPAPAAAPLPATTALASVAEVRKWARDNGYTVSAKGRLSTEVKNAWEAAHRNAPQHD